MATPKLSVNQLAYDLVNWLCDQADEFGVLVKKTPSGATLIDAGIEAKGGFAAGRVLTEICLGGLGVVRHTKMHIGSMDLPAVVVSSDHPKIACMASQYAGWTINVDKYFAMGSGPARALARVEKKLILSTLPTRR